MAVLEGCPFCRSNGSFKGKVLAETGQGYIVDNSFSPGDFLIIPSSHTESLQDLPDDWWNDFKRLLATLPTNLESYNLSLNFGKTAGQSVKHLHFWIIPRKDGKKSSGKGLAKLIAEIDGELATE